MFVFLFGVCLCFHFNLTSNSLTSFHLLAFLPPDVVELSKQNVDLNPEYADSLEDSIFSMHLMFDLVDESSMSKSEFREFAESYQLRGKEAFESGLDEVMHCFTLFYFILFCFVLIQFSDHHL